MARDAWDLRKAGLPPLKNHVNGRVLTGQARSAEKTFSQISFCACLTDVWAVKIAQPDPYLTQRLVSVAHYTTMVRRRKLSEAD